MGHPLFALVEAQARAELAHLWRRWVSSVWPDLAGHVLQESAARPVQFVPLERMVCSVEDVGTRTVAIVTSILGAQCPFDALVRLLPFSLSLPVFTSVLPLLIPVLLPPMSNLLLLSSILLPHTPIPLLPVPTLDR